MNRASQRLTTGFRRLLADHGIDLTFNGSQPFQAIISSEGDRTMKYDLPPVGDKSQLLIEVLIEDLPDASIGVGDVLKSDTQGMRIKKVTTNVGDPVAQLTASAVDAI